MVRQGRYPWSVLAVALMVIVSLWYGHNLKIWEGNRILHHDAVSYYAYLPAALIYDDLYFEFLESLPAGFEGRIWVHENDRGNRTLKMSMGNSLMWFPFFGVAHLVARAGPMEANGYSEPYQAGIFLAAVFYLGLGLYFLRRLMLRYFKEGATAVVLALLVLATNLMYYVVHEPGMSHVYSFCLFALFLLLADSWLEQPRWKSSAILGLTLGLITLIRPTNALVVAILPLWKLHRMTDLKSRIGLFLHHWEHILMVLLGILAVWTPQLVYWKTVSGEWLYYSYGDEGFFFLKPHIWKGLFSWRKGWWIYTPLMLLLVPGFYCLFRNKPAGHGAAVLLYLVLQVYITFSWWCWWYGGSYGSRPMIEAYAFMAFPLASLVEAVSRGRRWHQWLLAAVLAFFIMLNQFQMKQYRISLLHWDSMSWPAYKAIFLKNHWPAGYQQLLEPPGYEKARQGLPE